MSRSFLRVASTLLFVASYPTVASAAPIEVTTFGDVVADDGLCSLREAVSAADADAAIGGCSAGDGPDTIVLGAGTYTLALAPNDEEANAGGDLDLTSDVSVVGAGALATTIDGAGIDRVFDVFYPTGRIALVDLTVTGGQAPNASFGEPASGGAVRSSGLGVSALRVRFVGNAAGTSDNGDGGNGGAIWANFGSVQLVDVTFEQNVAPIGVGYGGALYASVNATVVRCRFAANEARVGAAAVVVSDEEITVLDSVFEANLGTHEAAVVLEGAAVKRVERTAFSGNHAAHFTSALTLYGGTPILRNVTAAGNSLTNDDGATIYIGSAVSSTFAVDHLTVVGNLGGGLVLAAIDNFPSLSIRSSVIAGNVDSTGITPSDCAAWWLLGGPTLVSDGYNVFGESGGCPTTGAGDAVVDGTTLLGTVLSPTAVSGPRGMAGYAPAPGGPASDAGSCETSEGDPVVVDQLLRPRPACGACDVGALELWPETFRVLDEAPGANCADGGKRIEVAESGFCPGVIADEVHYVCNGETGPTGDAGTPGTPGPAGDGQAVSTTTLPIGDTSCPYGGLRVEAGPDANADGTPDVVTDSADVCNGAPGAAGASGGCAAATSRASTGGASAGFVLVLVVLGVTIRRRRRAAVQ